MSRDIYKEIEQAKYHYLEALERGDFDAAAAYYTEDAVLMSSGSPPVQGREAIRDFLIEWDQLGVERIKFETLEVEDHGDTAVERAGYEAFGDSGTLDRGNYVNLWKCQPDGAWKVYWHINSSHQGYRSR